MSVVELELELAFTLISCLRLIMFDGVTSRVETRWSRGALVCTVKPS
jgi:hypothetical protein